MSRMSIAIAALLVLAQGLTLLLVSTAGDDTAVERSHSSAARDRQANSAAPAEAEPPLRAELQAKIDQLSVELAGARAALSGEGERRGRVTDAAFAHIDAEIDFLRELVYLLHDLGGRPRRTQEQLVDQALTRAEQTKAARAAEQRAWDDTNSAAREAQGAQAEASPP